MNNTIYMKKIITAICILTVLCGMAVGCSEKKDENGSMKAEDGRSYGGHIKADMGETVNTAFFDLVVEEAAKYDTYQFEDGLYQADAGKTYLVVKVTVKNTYEKDLPMSITDFTLDFDGNKEEGVIIGYGKSDLKQDDFMDNIFILKKGESITKSVLFTVEDKDKYTLNYAEYYEDEFEGDTFSINLRPEQRSATTEAVTEAVQEETTDAATQEEQTETTTEVVTEAVQEGTTAEIVTQESQVETTVEQPQQ